MRGYVDTLSTSQMEVFHVMHTEKTAQQTIGAAPFFFTFHAHRTPLYTRTDEICSKIHPHRCLNRKPVRDTFN